MIKIFNHGYIKLIDKMGTDAIIAESARVSTNSKSTDNVKTIRNLAYNGHFSVFEMGEIHIEVKAPIFVTRQWLRQRTGSYIERSLRYTVSDLEFYVPDWNDSRLTIKGFDGFCEDVNDLAGECYNETTKYGIPKELARINLPLSTYTLFRFKIDLNNLMKFLKSRTDSHAQYEMQEYGRAIETIFQELFPITFNAYLDYYKYAVAFSRMEMEIIKQLIYTQNIENSNLSEQEKQSFIKKLGIC